MNRERLLELAREFKRIYESNEPYIPGSLWTLTQHQQDHDRRVKRAQRLLSLEHIPRLTEAELRELFADTDALGFFRDQGKRYREIDERLSGGGTERIRLALLSLFQMAEAELTPEAFSEAQQTPGLGPVLISELLSYRSPSRYYTYSTRVTLRALKMLGEDVKATQPHGKKGEHYLYFAIRPLMDEICHALREVGFTEVDYLLADIFFELVLTSNDDSLPHYWKISPGGGAKYWNEFKELSCIAIGWEEAGDLREFNSQEEIKDFIMRSGWEWKLPYTSEQLWWLSHEMQTGDTVFAYGDKRILGVGKIVGEYQFEQDDVMHFAHRRPVKWNYLESKPIDNLPDNLQKKLSGYQTIIPLYEQEGQQVTALYGHDGPQSELSLSRCFATHGLHFTPAELATFYTALKTKGFVILTGISGTGKTRLAQYFAELLGSRDQFHFAAVRPDWRDSKSLLGYFNPLLGEKGQFQSTDFLDFILRAKAEYDRRGKDAYPYFVLLDEMNLAKVEYYFADFLSVLESGRRDEDLFTKEAIRFQYPEGIDGPPPELRLPPNLYFIGTVNVDETTYMFSPKVLDRAFTLELGTVNLEDYPGEQGEPLSDEVLEQLGAQLLPDFTRQGHFAAIDKTRVAEFAATHDTYRQHLSTLNTLLQPHDLHFGYRVFDEIMMFLANAENSPVSGGFNDDLDAAFDAAVLMKVLPKFHGTRGKLRLPLLNVFAWARTPEAGHELRKQAEELEKEITESEEKEKARLDLIEKLRESPGEARIRGERFAYPRTALKALRMLHDLYTTGFASFA